MHGMFFDPSQCLMGFVILISFVVVMGNESAPFTTCLKLTAHAPPKLQTSFIPADVQFVFHFPNISRIQMNTSF